MCEWTDVLRYGFFLVLTETLYALENLEDGDDHTHTEREKERKREREREIT